MGGGKARSSDRSPRVGPPTGAPALTALCPPARSPSADTGSAERAQAFTEVGTEIGRGRSWSARALPKLESPGNAVHFPF